MKATFFILAAVPIAMGLAFGVMIHSLNLRDGELKKSATIAHQIAIDCYNQGYIIGKIDQLQETIGAELSDAKAPKECAP